MLILCSRQLCNSLSSQSRVWITRVDLRTRNMSSTEGTWRDTLFVWDGILEIDASNVNSDGEFPVKWEGTWVGSEDCPDAKNVESPQRGVFDAFVASDNHFLVEGIARPVDAYVSFKPYEISMIGGIGYDLGEGDEKKKHKDDVHYLCLNSLRWSGNLHDQRNDLNFSVGRNEFGPFIAVGWARPGNRLTIGRRYLDEHDKRASWSIQKLRDAVVAEIFNGHKVRIPPWQCETLHS